MLGCAPLVPSHVCHPPRQQRQPARGHGASIPTCPLQESWEGPFQSPSGTALLDSSSTATKARSPLAKLSQPPPERVGPAPENFLPWQMRETKVRREAGLRIWSRFPELQPQISPQLHVLEVQGNQQLSASLFQVIFLHKTCWTKLPAVSSQNVISDAPLLPASGRGSGKLSRDGERGVLTSVHQNWCAQGVRSLWGLGVSIPLPDNKNIPLPQTALSVAWLNPKWFTFAQYLPLLWWTLWVDQLTADVFCKMPLCRGTCTQGTRAPFSQNGHARDSQILWQSLFVTRFSYVPFSNPVLDYFAIAMYSLSSYLLVSLFPAGQVRAAPSLMQSGCRVLWESAMLSRPPN